MNSVGKNIIITFFGESHSPYMGIVIDHLNPGIVINHDLIKRNLKKRRPKSKINTSRVESDEYEFISGIKNNTTTGAPLTIIIKNKDIQSKGYPNLNQTPRPSHADYPAYIKYKGANDYLGGGMFSGRLTALWVIVGSIFQDLLEKKNIYLGSHIKKIHLINDESFNYTKVSKMMIQELNLSDIPLINKKLENDILKLIDQTIKEKDSIGGVMESAIINLPVGLGEPVFHSIESYLSYLLFSIPSVKGVEFGDGFDISNLKGSEANDQYTIENGLIKTKTNHNGGCLGGLTTGMPLIIKTAFKPIASISQVMDTVDTSTKENTQILLSGRHDAQILTRVSSVIDAVLNFGILDLLSGEDKQ
ncbi:MAG: chorismate synthase [Candidatus Izemoplasmatales bacterium]